MDLENGHWQVSMNPTDGEMTGFGTHVWNVRPFSLSNVSVIFCGLVELMLIDSCWENCLVYLDDIVAFKDAFSTAWVNL